MVEIPISIAAQISTQKNKKWCKYFKIILPENNSLVTDSKDPAANKAPDRFKGMVVKKLSGRAGVWG